MNTLPTGETFMRLSEAARLLEVSLDSMYRFEANGTVTYRRVLGCRVVTEANIAAIRARRNAAAKARLKPQSAAPRATA